jgi:hypothetical protein
VQRDIANPQKILHLNVLSLGLTQMLNSLAAEQRDCRHYRRGSNEADREGFGRKHPLQFGKLMSQD